MDIVKFWKDQVGKWMEENKCGFCWEFHAPIKDDRINIQQFDDPCCVQVFVTDPVISKEVNYSPRTERMTYVSCRTTFTVRMLVHAELGTNMYNEIPEHPTQEGIWEKILNPLMECLGCGEFLDWCELAGVNPRVREWRSTVEADYTDEVLYGWKTRITIEEKNWI